MDHTEENKDTWSQEQDPEGGKGLLAGYNTLRRHLQVIGTQEGSASRGILPAPDLPLIRLGKTQV